MTKNSVEVLYDMETELLNEILYRIMLGTKDDIDIAIWKAKKLADLGTIEKLSYKIINKNIIEAVKLMKEEIESAGRESVENLFPNPADNKLYNSLPINSDPRLQAIWKVYENESRDATYRMGAKLLRDAPAMYIDIVETATAQVIAGQLTLRDAIRKASVDPYIKKGFMPMRDASGRKWSVEGYTQMVVRSSVRKVTTDSQEQRLNDLDWDLVEVSSHIGARELCAKDQGKVYKTNEWKSKTSWGKPAGLFGINCGHRLYAYVPGTKKTYSPYPEEENKKVYKESQKQRYYERQIRNAKRKIQLSETTGDKAQIKRSNDTIKYYDDKLNNMSRTRRPDREEIY
jgi:hypothetical protein